jgi:hypothetical protein
MAVVSVSEASRLSGRSRASLYRAFKSGEVSKSELPDGSPGVDTSELMRVYGPLKGAGAPNGAAKGDEPVLPGAEVLMERIRGLEAARAADAQLIEQLQQRIQDKDELVEEVRGQVRLLLMPPDRPAPAASPGAPRRGILSRILGRG